MRADRPSTARRTSYTNAMSRQKVMIFSRKFK